MRITTWEHRSKCSNEVHRQLISLVWSRQVKGTYRVMLKAAKKRGHVETMVPTWIAYFFRLNPHVSSWIPCVFPCIAMCPRFPCSNHPQIRWNSNVRSPPPCLLKMSTAFLRKLPRKKIWRYSHHIYQKKIEVWILVGGFTPSEKY